MLNVEFPGWLELHVFIFVIIMLFNKEIPFINLFKEKKNPGTNGNIIGFFFIILMHMEKPCGYLNSLKAD